MNGDVTSIATPLPTDVEKQILGMQAKLQQYKRFKAQYQAIVTRDEEQQELLARLRRENRKLRIALSEVALARKASTTVAYLSRYATKVLNGLGYQPSDIERFVGRFF